MSRRLRLAGLFAVLVFGLFGTLNLVGAAGAPDFTMFGYPTVAASMTIAPGQGATLTAGNQSVAIMAGTFDGPVTFDLLTATPSSWQSQVMGRTVRAAFAFRVTDQATGTILGTFKQPVMYTYSGPDAQSTDGILNTTAASPPVITPNMTPITFDGKEHHAFGGAGVGWLVVSAATSGAPSGTAPAPVAVPSAPSASVPASATTPSAAPRTGDGGGAAYLRRLGDG